MQSGNGFPGICHRQSLEWGIPFKTETTKPFQYELIDILSVTFNTGQSDFSIIIGADAWRSCSNSLAAFTWTLANTSREERRKTLSVVLCSSLDEEILSSSDRIYTVSYPLWQLLFISQELLISLKHYKARDFFQGGSVICWFAQWKFAEEVQGAGLFRCPVQTWNIQRWNDNAYGSFNCSEPE